MEATAPAVAVPKLDLDALLLQLRETGQLRRFAAMMSLAILEELP